MELKLFNSIDEIEENLWDSLLPPNEIIKTHRFLKAVERSNINNCNFSYVLFFSNGKAVANASIFCMDIYLDVIAPVLIKNICRNIRKAIPNFLKLKLVGCGTPVATCGNGIAISEKTHFKQIIVSLTQAIFQIAERERAHCLLYKEYNSQEAHAFDTLQSMGFLKLPSLPTTFIDVSWHSFDEYLKSLKKKYRLLVKNDLAKLNDPELSIEISKDFGKYANELWTLYMNVYEKAEVKFEQLTPEFFQNISIYLKGESSAILFKINNKIVAFELIIEDDFTLRPIYLGIDYEMNKNISLYFNSIYQIIKIGIERNKTTIELGQTSYYPKLKTGARVEPLYLYLKFKAPLVQYILKYPLNALFPERIFATKNVFKNQII